MPLLNWNIHKHRSSAFFPRHQTLKFTHFVGSLFLEVTPPNEIKALCKRHLLHLVAASIDPSLLQTTVSLWTANRCCSLSLSLKSFPLELWKLCLRQKKTKNTLCLLLDFSNDHPAQWDGKPLTRGGSLRRKTQHNSSFSNCTQHNNKVVDDAADSGPYVCVCVCMCRWQVQAASWLRPVELTVQLNVVGPVFRSSEMLTRDQHFLFNLDIVCPSSRKLFGSERKLFKRKRNARKVCPLFSRN